MGNSHPQTNRGPSERAKTQSPQPHGKNSNRPANGAEPAELSEVKQNKSDSRGELTPEEQEIDRRLEAKVGLGLVLLLAGAFSFMVWQKWTHRHQETYAQNENQSAAQEPAPDGTNGKQPPLDLEQPEPKHAPQADPFGEDHPILQVGEKKVVHPLLELQPAEQPVVEKKPEAVKEEKPEAGDPFGAISTPKEVVGKPQPNEAADPFGSDWTSDAKPAAKPDGKPEDPPVLEIKDVAVDADKSSTKPKEDLFGDISKPTPELRIETTENDPFANPEPKTSVRIDTTQESPAPALKFPDGPELTPQPEKPLAESKEEFVDPLPVLERVPERPETGSKNPFGDFDPVHSGSSQASSTTTVITGEFPEEKDPFATTVREQPRELAFPSTVPGTETVRTYRIEQNDTYWKISQKAYQTSRYYRALARYNQNRISDPAKMPLGLEILIPPERELELKYPDLFAGQQAKSPTIVQTGGDSSGFLTDKLGTPQYRVGEHDTLSGIAQRHLGRASRWIQIYELNRKQIPDPNRLKIGTILTLPSDASNVQVIGESAKNSLR